MTCKECDKYKFCYDRSRMYPCQSFSEKRREEAWQRANRLYEESLVRRYGKESMNGTSTAAFSAE